MNGLIDRLSSEDAIRILTLTAECEDEEELQSLREALQLHEQRHGTIRSVVFRESFFPFRKLRPHLTQEAFVDMLRLVGSHAKDRLCIPDCLPGMLRGVLAAEILWENTQLEHLDANEAITFARQEDVEILAEAISSNESLQSLLLGDSYMVQSRKRVGISLDPLFQVPFPRLLHLELSLHDKERRLRHSVISPHVLHGILKSSPLLRTLHLARLGLQKDHFISLALTLQTHRELENLCLDGNHSSPEGVQALQETLSSQSCRLQNLSLRGVPAARRKRWLRIFPRNTHLRELDLQQDDTEQFDTMQHHPSHAPSYGDNDTSLHFWLQFNAQGRAKWLELMDELSDSANEGGSISAAAVFPFLLQQWTSPDLNQNHNAVWYFLQRFPEIWMR